MSVPINNVIRAAGALLWRRSPKGFEVAIIHRRRYDDWTLPKGKLENGETWEETAVREVREETGYEGQILGFAGALIYETDGKSKVVCFWHMIATGEASLHIDPEVDEVFWFSPQEAQSRLQYPLEQALIEVCQAPPKEYQ